MIYEHLPKTRDIECITATLRAMYKAMTGEWPEEKYHYDPPEPPIPPDPPIPPEPDCKCSYWLEKSGDGKRDWARWFKCLFGGPKRCK
jgi:hypothetical protein